MNRFHRGRRPFGKLKKGFQAVLTAAVLAGFWLGIGSVSDQAELQQKKSLESALQKCVVQCYAMEGRYPESLAYMEDHYGLLYDKERFLVDYEILGSNIMPDITVIDRQEG